MTLAHDRTGAPTGRLRRWLGALLLGAAATACSAEGGRGDYAQDGDTGAAAPATAPDMNTAERIGIDSTTGMGGRTGERGVAGDSLGSRTLANPDSANRSAPPP